MKEVLGDQSERDKIHLIPFDAGSAAENEVRYENKRCEAWMESAELYSDGLVGMINDPVTVAELSSVVYYYGSNGSMLVEAKEDIKKRTGKSPGRADSIIIGLWAVKRAPTLTGRWRDEKTSTQVWIEKRRKALRQSGESYGQMEE
jgi:hypothetical protein